MTIGTAIPTNGATKNPKANKSKWMIDTAWTRIFFYEIKTPTNTPHNIRLIAEIHCIRMPMLLPRTLSILRNHKDKTTVKTQIHVHNSLVKLNVFSKRYAIGESFKTLYGARVI
jgi:hypothetical protein